MNDVFEKRVRAAAVAGWWVVLVAFAFVVLQWLIYRAIADTQLAWAFSPNLNWAFVQMVWFCAIVVLKVVIWLMVLTALWLTLWARQLRKRRVSHFP
ncbi:MAG: hypothetical protein WCB27_04420 [Thermoguttaceae bacterium]